MLGIDGGNRTRPYMSGRMPLYSDDIAEQLIETFRKAEALRAVP